MRERYLEVFDAITIDCLNGDKYKTGKKTPDGRPDPSVFSTEQNREGIQVGTAIALMERRPLKERQSAEEHVPLKERWRLAGVEMNSASSPPAELKFRHWWGKEKRSEIAESLEKHKEPQGLKPALKLGLPFIPVGVSETYDEWPRLVDLLPKSFPGVKSSRDEAVISIERGELEKRIADYLNPEMSDGAILRKHPSLMDGTATFSPSKVRKAVMEKGSDAFRFVRYAYRPFDVRWVSWEADVKLLDRPRPDYMKQITEENVWLSATQRNRKEDFYSPQVPRCLADHHIVESNVGLFPLYLREESGSQANATLELDFTGTAKKSGPQPNLSDFARDYLAKLGGQPEDLFFHIVAILHSPAYREENGGALRQDWPRVPLPGDLKTLQSGAALGRTLAALLDPETPVPGVTDLQVRPNLKGLGELAVRSGDTPVPGHRPAKADRNVRSPQKHPDLALAARWGYAGQGGVTMPGPGKTTTGTRGEGFLDIHLNATTRWKDVPENVWKYTLGGYQVLKKWLSYREHALLGRPLTGEEARDFTHHVRRIATLLQQNPELDTHYRASSGSLV